MRAPGGPDAPDLDRVQIIEVWVIQREASIDDQIRICRAEIERKGCNLIQVHTDPGISAASTFRPGHQKLLQDASAGALDVQVAENLDRSSRVT